MVVPIYINRLPPPAPTSSSTFCHTLPFISDGNSTFCGLKVLWKPYPENSFIIVMVIFCFMSIPLTLYCSIFSFSCLLKYWKKLCEEGLDPIYIGIKPHLDPCTIKNKKILKLIKFVEIVLPISFMLLYDAVDVCLDFKLYIEYSSGRLIDSAVYDHDSMVYISMMLLLFVTYFFKIRAMIMAMDEWHSKQSGFDELKLHLFALGLVYENAPELLLEYFYMEKYIHSNSAQWIVVKDIVSGIYVFVMCVVNFIGLIKILNKENRSMVLNVIISITMVVFGIASFFRIGGAVYQYRTQKVRRSCFNVFEGRIIQTPFDTGCLREIDYVVLVLGSSSLIGAAVIFFSLCSNCKRLSTVDENQS
eukprot:TCONS_00027912-protein